MQFPNWDYDKDGELILPPGLTHANVVHMLRNFHGVKIGTEISRDIYIVHPTLNTMSFMEMLNLSPEYRWTQGVYEIKDIIKKMSVRTVFLREILNSFFNMLTIDDITKDFENHLSQIAVKQTVNQHNEFQLFLASLKSTILKLINSVFCEYEHLICSIQNMFERAMEIYLCVGVVPYYDDNIQNNLASLSVKEELLQQCSGFCEAKFINAVERFVMGAQIIYNIPKYENILLTYNNYNGEVRASLMEPNKNVKCGRILKIFDFKNIHSPTGYVYSKLFDKVILGSVCETLLPHELKINILKSRQFHLHVKNMSSTTLIVQDSDCVNRDEKNKTGNEVADLKLSAVKENQQRLIELRQELQEINTKTNDTVLGALKNLSGSKDLSDIRSLAASTEVQTMLNDSERLPSISDIENLHYNNIIRDESVQPFRINMSDMGGGFSESLEKSKLKTSLVRLKKDLLRSKLQINTYRKNIQVCLDRISALGKNNANLLEQHTRDVSRLSEFKTKEKFLKEKIEALVSRVQKTESLLNREESSTKNKTGGKWQQKNVSDFAKINLMQCKKINKVTSIKDCQDINLINISRLSDAKGIGKNYKFLNVKFATDVNNEPFIDDVIKMWQNVTSSVFYLRDIAYSVNGNILPKQLSERTTRVYLNSFINHFTKMKIRTLVIFDSMLLSTHDISESFFTKEMENSVLGTFERRLILNS